LSPRVFVVQPIPDVAIDILREVADVEVYPYLDRQITIDELSSAARRSDYLFAMHETTITAEVLDANPKLKAIGTLGRVSETIDEEAAAARGIPILRGVDGTQPFLGVSRATADLTVAMILNLAYRVTDADRYVRTVGFKQEQTLALMGIGCPGKTIGLIGLGKVGTFMVPRLTALEMHVLYTKRTRLSPEDEAARGIEWVADTDDILKQSDFVVLACDYNPSTHLLIGERELKLMKPTAYLINTGRGRLIDEPAMIRALQDGTIAGAGLDVFWNEPPVTPDPSVPPELCKLDNVILAPHNGGATWDVRGEMNSRVARAIVAHIRGEA
jgi:lactate dehydrogenase-like 2-hydroxyacid dehydrogenase